VPITPLHMTIAMNVTELKKPAFAKLNPHKCNDLYVGIICLN
jgi:hypothetical protein